MKLQLIAPVSTLLIGFSIVPGILVSGADDRSLRMRGPLLGRLDENGCGGSSPDWCPETRECIAGWAETCPIEDGQTFVGGTELTCVDGRCSTDEICLYELGTARMGFFYATGVTGPYEVPSGCTLTCTGCEPAVADDSANLRPPRMRGGPNPAAVNCINKGGALETLTQADGGRYGVCLFSDGSACGDWALFRGECAKGDKPFFSAYCADSGGEMSNEDVIFMSYGNAPATYEVCTVNGVQCAAEDYYITGCVSAVSKSSAKSDKGNNCAGNPAQELFIKLTLARQFAVQFVGLYSLGDGDNDIEGDELEHLVDIVSQVTGVERDEIEEYIEKYDEEVTLNDVEAEVLKAWQDTCAAEMKEMLDGVILPRIAGYNVNYVTSDEVV